MNGWTRGSGLLLVLQEVVSDAYQKVFCRGVIMYREVLDTRDLMVCHEWEIERRKGGRTSLSYYYYHIYTPYTPLKRFTLFCLFSSVKIQVLLPFGVLHSVGRGRKTASD